MRRTTMLVVVTVKPKNGVMHTPQGTQDTIQSTLESKMSHYKPVVRRLPKDYPLIFTNPFHQAFLVQTDLEPLPDSLMGTPEAAQQTVRNILFHRHPPYEPAVQLAPPNLQPDYVS